MNMLIAIGDIHGEVTQLKTMIQVLIDKKLINETIIFLGDYIDRGENSVATLNYLIHLRKKYPSFIFLKGNHEEMLIDAWNPQIGPQTELRTLRRQIANNYLHEFRDKCGKVQLTSEQIIFLKKLKRYYLT